MCIKLKEKTLLYPQIKCKWSFILSYCYLEKPPRINGTLVCLNKVWHGRVCLDTSKRPLSAYMLPFFDGYHYSKEFWSKTFLDEMFVQ